MQYIKLGGVRAFPGVQPTKEQALKVLEEAAEVFGAWQELWNAVEGTSEKRVHSARELLFAEIADTVTACCNLAAALGVTDLTPYLAACEERNRERGRYGD
jgi:hypothetical protein